jgi:predicted porin
MSVKKKFLAICLGSLSAAAAHAQTSVTLYGIADGDVRVDRTSIGTLTSIGSGGESGTRWGIRGTEDLGGGLKAVFTFEQGFDLSDNSVPQGNTGGTTPNSPVGSTGSRLFSRTAQVGLSSAQAGDVLFGRAYTPFYVTWTSIDPMAGGLVGGAQNFASGNVTRFDNAIYYNSPKLYGFQANGAYRLGESTTDSVASGSVKNGGNAGNVSLSYAAGPLLAAVSFISTKSSLDNNTVRTGFAGAVYDFRVVKLDAMYFNTRNATTTKIQSYSLGLTVPINAFNVFAQAAHIDNKYNANGSLLKYNDANFIGFGGQYNLSKRTDLYVSWAKQFNQGQAVNVVTDASNAGLETVTGQNLNNGTIVSAANANIAPGFNPWSAQAGIRFKF